MNQTDTVSTSRWGLLSALRRRFAGTSLRFKLYVGLGVSIFGLLVVASVTGYTSVVNQQLMSRTLTRQRELADRASEINNLMLTIQNQAFEFYDTWDSTGFEERGQAGFEGARETYVTPLQEQLDRVREDVAAIEQLEPDEYTLTNLARVESSLDAYETTLLQMSDNMEALGFTESGEVAQMRAIMADLRTQLDEAGMESFKTVLLQISEYEKEYLLRSDLVSARLAQDLAKQLIEQIAATDDEQLSPADKAQLEDLLERYRDHFLAAANHLNLVNQSREVLVGQSDLINILVSQLFEQQRAEFDATMEQLRSRQFTTTLLVVGLALLTFFASVAVVYAVVGQITQPVQRLGEAARRLGAGELDVRAAVRSGGEIGATAAAFNLMADRLQELLAGLEQRVADRTRGLQAAAEVAHATTSLLDPDQLLRQVVDLARERFDLYYVGLFLVEEEPDTGRTFATLRAGTGEAGQQMIAQGHRLEVGGKSMIGWCVAQGEARIALDVGEEAVRFDNPLLPETRSEMALPLRSRGRVIGAMSVQSVEAAAFDEADIAVMQTMADQVAVALDNARLFAESNAALEATRRAYGELSGRAWRKLLSTRSDLCYRSDEHGVTVAEGVWRPEMERALQRGEIVRGDGTVSNLAEGGDIEARHPLAVPIKVRGDVIGVLDTYKPGDAGDWSAEELAMLETLADRLGEALEGARLYQDTQRRAAREQLTREITDKMRRATGVEGVVQTALDELFDALGTSRAFVRLETASLAQDDGKGGV